MRLCRSRLPAAVVLAGPVPAIRAGAPLMRVRHWRGPLHEPKTANLRALDAPNRVDGRNKHAEPACGTFYGGIMGVTAVSSGSIAVGGVVAGTGYTGHVIGQISGTPGGVGTYSVWSAR
jgi:hypothetical protein